MYYLQHAIESSTSDVYAERSAPSKLRSVSSPSKSLPHDAFEEDISRNASVSSPTRYRGSPQRRIVPQTPPRKNLITIADTTTRHNGLIQRMKNAWVSEPRLAVKIFNLLILSEFIISPLSPIKRAWEIFGAVLISINFISYFSKDLLQSTFGYLPITDIYFFLDILVRFKTGYIDSESGKVVTDQGMIARRYFKGWLLFDVVLSIPYHFLYRCWENTAALQLFTAIRYQEKNKHPIVSFLKNRQYRRQILSQLKEFLVEKKLIQNLFNLKPHKRSLLRRTVRLFGGLLRLTKRLKMVAYFTDWVSRLNSLVVSVRTLSIFSRHSMSLNQKLSSSGTSDE